MPASLSITFVLVVFYAIFLSQIIMLSIHYPRKIAQRIKYVVTNFPPSEYPKLYPAPFDHYAEEARKKGVSRFLALNYFIAFIGLSILLAMVFGGYQPKPKGGDEIFVMCYFLLQVAPILYMEIKEYKHYKRMREEFADNKRQAELKPRRLFDFISPIYVVTAILFYLGWVWFYINGKGIDKPWEIEAYFTLGLITAMNLIYAFVIAKFLFGKKIDPYKAYKDQLQQTESTIKVVVFSSIGISVFLTLTQIADEYALEVFDPVLMSFYMQLCAVFGIGLMVRSLKLEDIDFEVYKDEVPAAQQ